MYASARGTYTYVTICYIDRMQSCRDDESSYDIATNMRHMHACYAHITIAMMIACNTVRARSVRVRPTSPLKTEVFRGWGVST